MYILAGQSDHICAWRTCYRAAQHFGGHTEFILNSSGHVQSLVCPPDNFKARYLTNPQLAEDPDKWFEPATEHKGSWWEHWLGWLDKRSGEKHPAPAMLGNNRFPPLEPTPGLFVRGRP
jgi:polyhydroxyalkanoate synthase